MLGRRGGGWVVLQFVLMGAVVAACIWGRRWPGDLRAAVAVAGALSALAGVAVVVASARELGSSLTPFPKPPRGGRLAAGGPYRVVRHPIYSGGILAFGGLALALSPVAVVPTALLAVLWALKASVEERFLLAVHPEYGDYCRRTSSRLVPFVY